jgi:hypothetical protein
MQAFYVLAINFFEQDTVFMLYINRPINIRTHPSEYFSAYKVSGNRKKLFTSAIFAG